MKHIGMATLGRDGELRRLPSGDAVLNLNLAVNYYDKTAENNRATQWVSATLWGQQAERLCEYMVKGSRHCFTLSDMHIEAREWEGKTYHNLVARVDSVELGPRRDGEGDSSERPARAPAPAPAAQRPASKPATGFDDMDDDIPF
jgi:single-strand DNA-binding protein